MIVKFYHILSLGEWLIWCTFICSTVAYFVSKNGLVSGQNWVGLHDRKWPTLFYQLHLTPEQRHSGQGKAVLANRKAVYEAAKLKNPNRWSRNTRNWDLEERVWLNPENDESIEFIEEKSS